MAREPQARPIPAVGRPLRDRSVSTGLGPTFDLTLLDGRGDQHDPHDHARVGECPSARWIPHARAGADAHARRPVPLHGQRRRGVRRRLSHDLLVGRGLRRRRGGDAQERRRRLERDRLARGQRLHGRAQGRDGSHRGSRAARRQRGHDRARVRLRLRREARPGFGPRLQRRRQGRAHGDRHRGDRRQGARLGQAARRPPRPRDQDHRPGSPQRGRSQQDVLGHQLHAPRLAHRGPAAGRRRPDRLHEGRRPRVPRRRQGRARLDSHARPGRPAGLVGSGDPARHLGGQPRLRVRRGDDSAVRLRRPVSAAGERDRRESDPERDRRRARSHLRAPLDGGASRIPPGGHEPDARGHGDARDLRRRLVRLPAVRPGRPHERGRRGSRREPRRPLEPDRRPEARVRAPARQARPRPLDQEHVDRRRLERVRAPRPLRNADRGQDAERRAARRRRDRQRRPGGTRESTSMQPRTR